MTGFERRAANCQDHERLAQNEWTRTTGPSGPKGRRLFFVFFFQVSGVLVVVACFVDQCDFERVDRDDLQVGATLVALYRLAFLYFVCIHDNRVIALRAYNSHLKASVLYLSTAL